MLMGIEHDITTLRITLRAARVSSGYTTEEAAKCINISPTKLCEYERDSGEMTLSTAIHILKLYRFSIDTIYFGNESEFIKKINNK
jgi:DNA-binding XRE family transcriptional regulator